MPDFWEILHGFDPLDDTGDSGADGDLVSNADEYLHNTDPNAADTDGDGTDDADEIAQGSNPANDADQGEPPEDELQELVSRVGGDYTAWDMTVTATGPKDYRTFHVVSPKYGEWKDQPLQLQQNNGYEITLTHPSPRPQDNPPWYCWEARVGGLPATAPNPNSTADDFFIVGNHWLADDSQGLLAPHTYSQGTNLVAGKTATLTPIDITFEAVGDNEPITDNKRKAFDADGNPLPDEWMLGKGKRIFPDAKDKDDQTERNRVKVKVMTSLGAGRSIYLKAFDVDDPTENDPEHVIDDNDTNQLTKEDDNKDLTGGGTRIPGKFASTQTDTVTLIVGTNGIATLAGGGDVEFIVTMQPGDNYRIAVATKLADLIGLQVESSATSSYVEPSDEQPSGFSGVVSPMLTVWRKLYLEVDSMTAVPSTGGEKNYEEGTIVAVTPQNVNDEPRSTVRLSIRLTGPADRYEWGHIDIAGVDSFEVRTNTDNLISNDDLVVTETPPSVAEAKTFKIYDDDDKHLTALGLPPPLPRNDQHAAVINGIQGKFAAAYIQIEDANALGWNPRQTIDFKLNSQTTGFLGASVFDDAKDLYDGPTKRDFWAHTLVFNYQPEASADNDPDSEARTSGGTPKDSVELWSYGYSVVYLEPIRESTIGSSVTSAVIANPTSARDFREAYRARFLGVVAHEIGHSLGGRTGPADHAEGGIMRDAGSTIDDNCEPLTIKRFRRAWTWSYQVGGQ